VEPSGVDATRIGLPVHLKSAGSQPANLSLIDAVRAGRVQIPRTHRAQKAFFRLLRKAAQDPKFGEQVQRFRDAVVLSALRDNPGARGLTIAFTGPRGGEGSSLVSLMLGLSLGECAMRSVAHFDGRFNAQRFDVLADVLGLSKNAVNLQKGFSEIAGYYNERFQNVYFLHNISPERSMSFFSDKRLQVFLDEVRSRFDFTILDLPPLLRETASMFALAHVDRLYLVVEAGKTRLSDVERCMQVAEQAGRALSGVVINRQRAPWWARFFWREFFF